MDDNMSPYELGWVCGYDDELPESPFEEGSEEYEQYMMGYVQGCQDC